MPLKLQTAASAILAWAVWGCLSWQASATGLNEPEAVRQAVSEYRSEQDPFMRFVSERCEVGPDLKVVGTDLVEAHNKWTLTAGDDAQPLTRNALYAQAEKHGFKKERPGGRTVVRGLALASTQTIEGDDEEGDDGSAWWSDTLPAQTVAPAVPASAPPALDDVPF